MSKTERQLRWGAFVCVAAVWCMVATPLPSIAWAQDAAAAAQQPESRLWWFIRTAGLIGAFILALSIYFVAMVARLFVEFRSPIAIPPQLVTQTDEMLAKSDFVGIYNLLK